MQPDIDLDYQQVVLVYVQVLDILDDFLLHRHSCIQILDTS